MQSFGAVRPRREPTLLAITFRLSRNWFVAIYHPRRHLRLTILIKAAKQRRLHLRLTSRRSPLSWPNSADTSHHSGDCSGVNHFAESTCSRRTRLGSPTPPAAQASRHSTRLGSFRDRLPEVAVADATFLTGRDAGRPPSVDQRIPQPGMPLRREQREHI